MSKYFDYVNLTLLALLGGLCVLQWSHEKDYGVQLAELRLTSSRQADKLAVQEETIQRDREDSEEFKREIVAFKTQADENSALIRQQKAQIFQLDALKEKNARQLADWQKALTEYKTAIAGRDDNIKTLLSQREQLVAANKDSAAKANQAIVEFNDLATKYEDVVKRYNALVAHAQSEQDAKAPAAK